MIISQLDEKHSRLRELRTKAAKDKVPGTLTQPCTQYTSLALSLSCVFAEEERQKQEKGAGH